MNFHFFTLRSHAFSAVEGFFRRLINAKRYKIAEQRIEYVIQQNPEYPGAAEKLLEIQKYATLMYTSCGWFFEKLARPEPRYVIAQAMRALQLVRQATGVDLGPDFREALCAAKCSKVKPGSSTEIYTAAELYDEIAAAHEL